jgi:predicted GIY-YIG superfamily endonuclease
MNNWVVYLLYNTKLDVVYCGISTDVMRRVKQHNGSIKGGARNTKRGQGFWELRCYMDGLNSSVAGKIEHRIKKTKRVKNKTMLEAKIENMKKISDELC